VITADWEAKRWDHIALVRRGEAIEAWLNGTRVTKEVQKPTSDASVSGPEHLHLGLIVDNSDRKHFFKGSLDDVRIYNRALSEREVKTLAAMGKVERVRSAQSQEQGVVLFEC
jgi:hypothetical protein